MKSFTCVYGRITLFVLSILVSSQISFSQLVAKSLTASNNVFVGFYQYTPTDYSANPTKKYPLIIFLHGIGERGNGTTDLSRIAGPAIPGYIRNHAWNMTFTWNGKTETFLVLAPQLSTNYGSWQDFYVDEMIKFAKANLRYDPDRVFLTGLSLGGGGVWHYASSSLTNATQFAGIAPVCGTCAIQTACNIANANLPVWAFHALNDGTVGVGCTTGAVGNINKCNASVKALMTLYPDGGHGIWDRAYDSSHNLQNPNIYEWMLAQNRSLPANKLPVANAGADVATGLLSTVHLSGAASYDTDGTIVRHIWKQISGPNSILSTLSAAVTTLTGLSLPGTYQYELTAVDNRCGWTKDTVQVTVSALPPPNQNPAANAGSDISLTLPTNTTSLNGSGSNDPDGSISSYSWTKISGPAQYSISNANVASPVLSNLAQGTYAFRLSVTDNGGLSDADTVVVTVNAVANQAPIARAGSDVSITLPLSNTTLNGSGSSDPDGSISSYSWSKIAGPAQFTFGNASAATTTLSNLVQGTYSIRLVVTDNNGATAADTMTVVVNSAANQAPIADAGSDISITLPLSNTTLNGSGSSDPDGSISSYSWSKIAGPAQFTFGNASAASTTLSNLVQGTYSIRLVVTDNNDATAADTVTVVVNSAANQPPIAVAGSDISITLPLNNTTLNGSGSSDPDGSISSYSWSKIAGPAQFTFGNASAATTALSNLVQGTYSFRLLVTDNSGATAADTITVTVNPAANQAPIAVAGSDISITLPVNNTTLNGSGSSDPDGSISSYSWSKIAGPAQFAFGNASAATTALSNLVQGTYGFRLLVTDNSGATAADTITVIVSPAANQPPIANAGSDISITLPANSVLMNGSASVDPDGTISNYSWSKISGPAQFTIPNPNAAASTVSNLVQGTYTFVLSVTDNGGLSATDTVNVTVNAAPPPPNQAPVAIAGNDQVITLPLNAVSVSGASSSDPDGTIVAYKWSALSGPAQYTILAPLSPSTTINNLVQGTYVFTLAVTDDGGITDLDTVIITVNAAPPPPNQAPVADAGTNVSITLPLDYTNLFGNASTDVDGSIVSYQWTKISGPAQFNLVSPNAVTSALNNLVQGTYQFELTVTDNGGLSNVDTVMVIVNATPPPPNQAPQAIAGADITITLPVSSTSLDGSSSSDADGSITAYRWTKIGGPAPGTIVNSGSSITDINGLAQGVYTFRLRVTDDGGLTSSDTVTVTVNVAPPPPNQAPIADAGTSVTIILPVDYTNLYGSASTDPDGTIAVYSWQKLTGPAQYTILNASASTTALYNLVPGTYTFSLTVTDNGGLSSSDTVTVQLNPAPPPPNQAPVANAGTNISLTLPLNSTTLAGSASYDPDGSISTFHWARVSGPAQFNIVNQNSPNTVINNLVQGTYLFALTVTDAGGLTSTDSVTVHVNAAPPVNQAPVANAGANATIVLPLNSVTLNGSGSSDVDGAITSYSWTRISGPAQYSIAAPASQSSTVTNLVQGVYQFALTVTDNGGLQNTDTVTITVNTAPPLANLPPTAEAGSDVTLMLPANSVTLDGSASVDPDGAIVSYNWTKISGPSQFTLSGLNTATITLTNLAQGAYRFVLAVTDNGGLNDADTVTLTVSSKPNQAPVAKVGSDFTVALPDPLIQLDGTASFDPDGTIAQFNWRKISGSGAITIVNSTSATASVVGVQEGDYIFELTVTDNNGATATARIKVTVMAAPNKAPVADAGNDSTIAIPDNTALLSATRSYDPDGTLISYQWRQVGGHSSVAISDPNKSIAVLTGLELGDYVFELSVQDDKGAVGKDSVHISVINTLRSEEKLVIYPNPSSGSTVNIRCMSDTMGTMRIDLFDLNGKFIRSGIYSKAQSFVDIPVNVNGLKSGTYIVRVIIDNKKQMTGKLIRQ